MSRAPYILVPILAACLVAQLAASEPLVRLANEDALLLTADEDRQPSPSDRVQPVPKPEPPPPVAPEPAELEPLELDSKMPDACVAADGCCDWDRAPWELFPATCCGLKIGGWLQGGYHTAGANGIGAGAFNSYPNAIQLQQAWLFAEKKADNGGCGWDWGFRLDYVYGTDAQDTQAFGSQPGAWDTSWDAGAQYGHALPQLYGEVAVNDWKFKIGHFFRVTGYEVIPAPNNFFYSHARCFELIEPYTHTGVLGEWAVTPCLTAYAGWTMGWDSGYSNYEGSNFLGGLGWTFWDNLKLTYIATAGDFGFGPGGSDNNGYEHSVVLNWGITERLSYVFQSDYMRNDLFLSPARIGLPSNGQAFGVNQYMFYKLNNCWSLGGRLEWLDYAGNDLAEVTAGVNWRPHPNVLFRPELRLDTFGNSVPLQDSTVFGMDAILLF